MGEEVPLSPGLLVSNQGEQAGHSPALGRDTRNGRSSLETSPLVASRKLLNYLFLVSFYNYN